jgi:hypothetical protein
MPRIGWPPTGFALGDRALQHWNVSQPDPADDRRLLIQRKESIGGPLAPGDGDLSAQILGL